MSERQRAATSLARELRAAAQTRRQWLSVLVPHGGSERSEELT